MKALSVLKVKIHEKKMNKRAMSSASGAFIGVGAVGLLIFGYEIIQSGGLTSLTGMADGVGLILSLVVLVAGVYTK